MSLISSRMDLIKPSATLAINSKAIKLKSEGINIISLSTGEPDFDTMGYIKDAAISAIKEGFTKYTAVEGIKELREAIKQKYIRENSTHYSIDEIIVSSGAKQVIYNAFMASINKGDEVIIPAPYWVSYPEIALLAEGVPVFIECSDKNNFKLTPELLERNISSKTKWIILNSPSNPTGICYTKEELKALSKVLLKYEDIYILSDDIYEDIVYEGFKSFSLVQVEPLLKPRILVVNGVSKTYSMTGWRIGYGLGPQTLIENMITIQSQITSNPCSISQKAAVAALNNAKDFLKDALWTFMQKRDFTINELNKTKFLSCIKPEGAFYLFPNCSNAFGRKTKDGNLIRNSIDFCTELLSNYYIAAVPGSAFGMDGYFRISYATSIENLKEACFKIREFCASLS